MGYFAVIGNDKEVPTIERCHINLWRYDGILTSRVCCIDVGLALTATDSQPGAKTFRLALPLSSDDAKATDLAKTMQAGNVASLIFGRAVKLDDHAVSYTDRKGEEIKLVLTSTVKVQVDKDASGNGYSVWNVELPHAPTIGALLYVRFRIHVAEFSRGWTTHRDGELIDMRVADARESVSIAAWESFDKYVVPIPNLRIFIIAPVDLPPTIASPAFTVRALEGSVWKTYTKHTPFRLFRTKASAIYGFRPDARLSGPTKQTQPDEAVNSNNPFRVYLRLGSRPLPRWLFVVVLSIALIVATVLGRQLGCVEPWSWAARLWDLIYRYVARVSITSVFLAFLKWGHLLERFRRIGKVLRAVDKWLLFEA
jgi:hypothetical protein